ncbi:MAG: glycosyltransferase [Desulfobacterales bacterium]|nr:glycosyltransferase [Desulfobacterales bacterium]MBF0398062.1 glycosyltransferase [Desulfobacterales bacterium]
MNVSVIVICLNEEKNISECLDSLLKQSYPKDMFEIIIVDGNSNDHTLEIINNIVNHNKNVRLVLEHKKGAAAGRNAGIQAAQFDHIAFIDADCEAPINWLKTLVENFKTEKAKDNSIIAVGGSNIPPQKTKNFVKAIGIAMDSYLGSFNSVQGRKFKEKRYVPSLSNSNALYEKQKLIEIGFYDETLNSEGEDADINFRLHKADYKMLYIPNSFVWHKMRPTLKTWLKNMIRYGKGRSRLLKRYPEMWNSCYLLPILFIITMAITFFSPFSNLFLLPLLYFPVLIAYSLLQCVKSRAIHLLFPVTLVYLIQHFGYAIGEVYGLLHPKVK